METNFRPLTIHERFFQAPVMVNVPYSTLPQNLPEISTAPVMPLPAPDLSGKQFHQPSFLTAAGIFIAKNKWPIIGVIIIGGICWYMHYQKVQKAKDANPKSGNNQ